MPHTHLSEWMIQTFANSIHVSTEIWGKCIALNGELQFLGREIWLFVSSYILLGGPIIAENNSPDKVNWIKKWFMVKDREKTMRAISKDLTHSFRSIFRNDWFSERTSQSVEMYNWNGLVCLAVMVQYMIIKSPRESWKGLLTEDVGSVQEIHLDPGLRKQAATCWWVMVAGCLWWWRCQYQTMIS